MLVQLRSDFIGLKKPGPNKPYKKKNVGFLPWEIIKKPLDFLGQVRLDQIRLGFRLGQVRLGQVRLGQVRLGQVRLGQVSLGQVRLGQVRLGQVRLGQVRLGQVSYGFFKLRYKSHGFLMQSLLYPKIQHDEAFVGPQPQTTF